jgi:hypothetical protein
METATLSKSVVIAISVVSASSSVALILLFFIFGFICGCCFKQKYSKNKTSDGVDEIEPYPKVTALYEDILPNFTCTQQNLEMEQNTAYGSAKQ